MGGVEAVSARPLMAFVQSVQGHGSPPRSVFVEQGFAGLARSRATAALFEAVVTQPVDPLLSKARVGGFGCLVMRAR